MPTLTLGLGLTQLHAEATSLLAIIPTAVAGAMQQYRYGNVRWRAAALIGVVRDRRRRGGGADRRVPPEHVLRGCSPSFCCSSWPPRLRGAALKRRPSSNN